MYFKDQATRSDSLFQSSLYIARAKSGGNFENRQIPMISAEEEEEEALGAVKEER